MHRPDRARSGGLPALLVAIIVSAAACGGDDAEGVSAGGEGDAGVVDEAPDGADELPNDCPAGGCVITIEGAKAGDGGEIQLTLDANYTPDFERNHIHVYWDVYEAGAVSADFQNNGYDEQGRWDPTDSYPRYLTQAETSVASAFRQGSTTLCVTAANSDHTVIDASIVDCMDVGDLVG
ncbi:MAG: hypothetical protein ACFCVK_08660 [Acidimicrobiales bacterium]